MKCESLKTTAAGARPLGLTPARILSAMWSWTSYLSTWCPVCSFINAALRVPWSSQTLKHTVSMISLFIKYHLSLYCVLTGTHAHTLAHYWSYFSDSCLFLLFLITIKNYKLKFQNFTLSFGFIWLFFWEFFYHLFSNNMLLGTKKFLILSLLVTRKLATLIIPTLFCMMVVAMEFYFEWHW